MGLSTVASNPIAIRNLRKSPLYHIRVLPTNSSSLVLSSTASQSLAGLSCQSRTLCSRRDGGNFWRDRNERITQQMEKYRGNHLSKRAHALRRQALLDQQQSKWSHRVHPWSGWGWGWRSYKSSQHDKGSNEKDSTRTKKDKASMEPKKEDWWETERARYWREMEQFKKEVEEDPFTALFGRRSEPIQRRAGYQSPWSTFCRTFLGLDDAPKKPEGTAATATSIGSEKESPSHSSGNSKREAKGNTHDYEPISTRPPEVHAASTTQPSFQFDPISGRMVPHNPPISEVSSESTQVRDESAVDIPIKTFKSYRAQFGYDEPGDGSEKASVLKEARESTSPKSNENVTRDSGSSSAKVDAEQQGGKNDVFYMAPPEKESTPSSSILHSSKRDGISASTDDEPFSGTVKDPRAAHRIEETSPQRSNEVRKDHTDSEQSSLSDVWSYLTPPKVRETAGRGSSTVKSLFAGGNKAPEQTGSANTPQQKEYNLAENKADDVDLLRPSDIRASLNSKKTKYELDAEKQRNRDALEEEFESYQDTGIDIDVQELRRKPRNHEVSDKLTENEFTGKTLEKPAAEPIMARPDWEAKNNVMKPAVGEFTPQPEDSTAEAQRSPESRFNKESLESNEAVEDDELVRDIRSAYEDSYGKITTEHRQGRPLSDQQAHHTVAPDSITHDLSRASAKHPDMKIVTIGSPVQGQDPKQNDSHRNSQLDDLLKDAKQFSESRDALMKEIAHTIGRIEPRQPSAQPVAVELPSSNATSVSPAVYRVLAYDSSTLQVTTAETTSSFYSTDEVLHPAEVLSRLNNPAKFLPYFAAMQADGYEIVSGGGDILVFKKVRDAGTPVTTREDSPLESANSIDNEVGLENSTTQVEKQSVDHTSENGQTLKRPSTLSDSSSSPIMVRRQETVFTGGPPNWSPYPPPPPPVEPIAEDDTQKEESSVRKTSRRVLLTGVVTAATCYALGVVSEYFRTGGADGRGPEGFTEFESERRRRD